MRQKIQRSAGADMFRAAAAACLLCLSCHVHAGKRLVRVIEPTYDVVTNFMFGRMAVFNSKGMGGIVTSGGKEILPCVSPVVVPAYSGPDGVAYYYDSAAGRGTLIDMDGNKVAVLPEGVLSNTAQRFNKGMLHVFVLEGSKMLPKMKWGMADTSGKIVVPTVYDAMGAVSEGLINAYINGKGGYILPDGKVAQQFIYDEAYPFSNGLAKVGQRKHGKMKYGLIDRGGNVVVPLEYDSMQDGFSDGRKAVGKLDIKSGKWSYGFIGTDGEVAVPLKFSMVGTFNEGLCAVTDREHKDNIAFINTAGDIVIPYIDKSDLFGMPVFNDGACILRCSGKAGAIDRNGNVIVPFEYDNETFLDKSPDFLHVNGAALRLPVFVNGLAVMRKKGRWGVFDKAGRSIIPAEYEQIVGSRTRAYFFVRKKGRWGMVDSAGSMLLPPVYQDLSINQDEDMVCYKEDKKWGFMKIFD